MIYARLKLFFFSLLQVSLITLVQLVSNLFQHRNYVNACRCALPILCHPSPNDPELGAKCSFLIPIVKQLTNTLKWVVGGALFFCLFVFCLMRNSWGIHFHDVGILIYFIQTRLKQITLAWLCMQNVIRFFSLFLSLFLSLFFTCIINKWHLDFIKVPRPLWQYKVTGGHFNISREHLSWYYLCQPVAPREGVGRREVPCLRLPLPGRLRAGRNRRLY